MSCPGGIVICLGSGPVVCVTTAPGTALILPTGAGVKPMGIGIPFPIW